MKQAYMLRSRLWTGALCVVFCLLCVWQVPGTIALRHSLLALLLPLSLTLFFWRQPLTIKPPINPMPWLVLAMLTGWIVLVVALWGVEPNLSWQEFRGQWLSALAVALMGTLLARAAQSDSPRRVMALIMTVFGALLFQIALHYALDAWYWISTGDIPFRQAPVLYLPGMIQGLWEGRTIVQGFTGESVDKFSYVNNTLGALVVAELMQRIMTKKRWLNIGWPLLILSLFAVLGCTYLLKLRNGNVGLLLLLGFAILTVLVYKARYWSIRKLGLIAGFVLLALVGFGTALYKSDLRWQNMLETMPIAWDTQTHQAWRKVAPYPELASGQLVDKSNYERIAWAKEGAILIQDHPLGTGYNRNAFGDGIDRKYEMNGVYRGGHSHSGLVDFGIANGLPGLLLWLAFLGVLFAAGWAAFVRGQIAPGLALMFIVSGFLSRSIVDSNLRDHVLQQFMLLVMVFVFSLPSAEKTKGTLHD